MAWGAFPVSDDVDQQRVQRRAARPSRRRERIEHVAEERDDRCRTSEPQLDVADFGHGAIAEMRGLGTVRTRLHFTVE